MLYINLPDTKTIKKRNAISTSNSEFMLISLFAYQPNDKGAPEIANREFKKLGRQLQRELRIKIEFSDLVALKKKLPNTSFVSLSTSNCYMNSNRDLQVYRVGTHLLMTNPLENNIL